MGYEIEFAASVKPQLEGLSANHRTEVLQAIENQLIHEPLVETRNRKRLRPNPFAPWELRVGAHRVFYDVKEAKDTETKSTDRPSEFKGKVYILAIGHKTGNVLRISGKEVQL